MEARKITIVSTKTQTKNVIMSEAETLGQLKHDLANAGIDYADMTFFEGTSRTELNLDDAILPKDVPYTNRTTGETKITNELVFMLTYSNKKIKSGMERKQIYDIIKKSRGLQVRCIQKFGKNYTQVSNNDLMSLIEEFKVPTPVEDKAKACNCKTESTKEEDIKKAFITLINRLYNNQILDIEDVDDILEYLDERTNLSSPYDDCEINKMFEGML